MTAKLEPLLLCRQAQAAITGGVGKVQRVVWENPRRSSSNSDRRLALFIKAPPYLVATRSITIQTEVAFRSVQTARLCGQVQRSKIQIRTSEGIGPGSVPTACPRTRTTQASV